MNYIVNYKEIVEKSFLFGCINVSLEIQNLDLFTVDNFVIGVFKYLVYKIWLKYY
jgi:hypothetical protein